MLYLLIYLAVGVALTAWLLWRSWKADPAPLWVAGDEAYTALVILAIVTLWPMFVWLLLEAEA